MLPDERHHWLTTVRRSFGEGVTGRARRLATGYLPPHLLERALKVRRRLTGRPEPRMPWEFRPAPAVESTRSVDEIVAQRGNLDWQPPLWYRSYWPQMRWFVLPTFSDAHVRINLRGRERDGIVAPEDYDAACDELEALLRDCRNPRTGNPVVQQVIRVRAEDPYGIDGPDGDLVVLWSEPLEALEHPRAGVVGPVAFDRTGEHSSKASPCSPGRASTVPTSGPVARTTSRRRVLTMLGVEPPEILQAPRCSARPPTAHDEHRRLRAHAPAAPGLDALLESLAALRNPGDEHRVKVVDRRQRPGRIGPRRSSTIGGP